MAGWGQTRKDEKDTGGRGGEGHQGLSQELEGPRFVAPIRAKAGGSSVARHAWGNPGRLVLSGRQQGPNPCEFVEVSYIETNVGLPRVEEGPPGVIHDAVRPWRRRFGLKRSRAGGFW
jgi:hypothetical protein